MVYLPAHPSWSCCWGGLSPHQSACFNDLLLPRYAWSNPTARQGSAQMPPPLQSLLWPTYLLSALDGIVSPFSKSPRIPPSVSNIIMCILPGESIINFLLSLCTALCIENIQWIFGEYIDAACTSRLSDKYLRERVERTKDTEDTTPPIARRNFWQKFYVFNPKFQGPYPSHSQSTHFSSTWGTVGRLWSWMARFTSQLCPMTAN